MMMSEFIARTKFEPTAEEYQQIEEQYYQFEGNKDQFCRSWVRHGGIQRLSRERVRKINDLKKQLEELNKTYNEDMQFYEDRDAKLCKELNDTRAEKKAALDKLSAIRSVLI